MAFERQLVKQATIHIGVGDCSVFDQVLGLGGDLHGLRCRAYREAELQLRRQSRAHVHVLGARLKAGSNHGYVVVVEWNVEKGKLSLVICLRGFSVMRDRILNLYCRTLNGCSRWVKNGAPDRSGVAATRLRVSCQRRGGTQK